MIYPIGQSVVWWKGLARGRLSAVFGAVIGERDAKLQIELDDGGKRWIPAERIQPIQVWHHSWIAPDHIEFEPPTDEWGQCTIHGEIGTDLFPTRCVYQFGNGRLLKYDRTHWFDDFGQLGTLAYCDFRWVKFWGESTVISPAEFERVWKLAIGDEGNILLDRTTPKELAEIQPWTRRPIQIGG